MNAAAKKYSVPEGEPLLKLTGLTKNFGGLKVVEGVDLSIPKGELRCLIGPNGAGKSTIFKMIMGVHKPTAGKIWFEGKDITNLPTWKRSSLGLSIKMQIPGVFNELTVKENIRIAAQHSVSSKKLDKEINRLLELVGISHLANEPVGNLSHGQQQWLEIAMSLACDPDLLLLDEPAAGMGPEEKKFTVDLVKSLNKSGITILFIDHDMEFVRSIADKVTVLHYGKLFAEGTLEEIENNEEVVKIYLGRV